MLRHTLTWVAIFVVIALMFLRLPVMVAKQDAVVNTYSALVEVDALTKRHFVEAIHDDRLVDGAIRGMMARLDPYSGYVSARELPAFLRRSEGDYDGIGVELGVQGRSIVVIAPIEGGPAARAGIRPGDAILSINGRSMEGRTVFEVEDLLSGASGADVRLELQGVGESSPRQVVIEQGPVCLRTVRGFARGENGAWDYWIDHDHRIGYVRVSSFRQNTLRDFDDAMRKLGTSGLSGLILDLRLNPGGLMTQGIEMVDRFVSEGVILSTVTRRRAVHEYRATGPDEWDQLPLVVLVNGGSASAAEIVAGSLQALGRAVVVGERSFGKGSVQHLIPLEAHDSAIKLTVAYYRLPNGRIIHRNPTNGTGQDWGVIPDVPVTLSEAQANEIRESRRVLDLAFLDVDSSRETESEVAAVAVAVERPDVAANGRPGGLGHDSNGAATSIPMDRGMSLTLDPQLQEALRQVQRRKVLAQP